MRVEKAMKTLPPMRRYCGYLKRFGIDDPGDRVMEFGALDLGGVHFFAYSGSDGTRLKAAITPGGTVTPGGHASDDWYGFLSAMPNALDAAERIAWLETDEAITPHSLPRTPTITLKPGDSSGLALDPAQWAFVTTPELRTDADGTITLRAWFLPSGDPIPTRWIVKAKPGAHAVIARDSAASLLMADAGSAEAAARETAARARHLLVTGAADEQLWALQTIGGTGDRMALPSIGALLASTEARSAVKMAAVGALMRLADPAAVTLLAVALRTAAEPEVRSAAAQALGRLGGSEAIKVLADAIPNEPNVLVRVEIVHALAAQGAAAATPLAKIANDDADELVRGLARGSLGAIR
jgi:hypothetical protein